MIIGKSDYLWHKLLVGLAIMGSIVACGGADSIHSFDDSDEPLCGVDEHRDSPNGRLDRSSHAYQTTALKWRHPDVTFSFAPDGAQWGTSKYRGISALFQTLDSLTPRETWRLSIARSFQFWANRTNLNFSRRADDGSEINSSSEDTGDIRIGTIATGGASGWAYFPGRGLGGNIVLRSTSMIMRDPWWERAFSSVVTHEIGHALGLRHSDVLGTVMGGGSSTFIGLAEDDIAGIQSIYGQREDDPFDRASRNDTRETATNIELVSSNEFETRADLTSYQDIDHYRISVPRNSTRISVSVDPRELSLLAPQLTIFDTSGNQLATASGEYGTVVTVTLTSAQLRDELIIQANGVMSGTGSPDVNGMPSDNVFGMGAYHLRIETTGGSTGCRPWTHSDNRFDADNNGQTTALDALLLVQQLANGNIPLTGCNETPHYPDVDGDGALTPLDVLAIVQELS